MESEKVSTEIPELMEQLKPLCRVREFDKVRDILMAHEKELKFEFEKLKRELDLMKEKCSLAEVRSRRAESEREMLLADLQNSRKERGELEAEMRVLRERLVGTDQNYKIINEQNQLIYSLNAEVKKLKACNLESNPAVMRMGRMGREEVERLKGEKLADDHAMDEIRKKLSKADEIVEKQRNLNLEASETVKELRQCVMRSYGSAVEMRRKQCIDHQTIQELRRANLEASKTIEQLKQRQSRSDEIIQEMRHRQAGADKIVEELRCQCLEALWTVEKLKSQKLKVAESNKKRFGMLLPLNMKIEEGLASLKKLTAEDIGNQAKLKEKSCAMVLDDDFLCYANGLETLDNVGVLADVDSLMIDCEDLLSPSLTKEEARND